MTDPVRETAALWPLVYAPTAAGLAILDQSQPGEWDVMVIDAVDVGRAVEANYLAELPADQLPTADFFPELVMADNNTVAENRRRFMRAPEKDGVKCVFGGITDVTECSRAGGQCAPCFPLMSTNCW